MTFKTSRFSQLADDWWTQWNFDRNDKERLENLSNLDTVQKDEKIKVGRIVEGLSTIKKGSQL